MPNPVYRVELENNEDNGEKGKTTPPTQPQAPQQPETPPSAPPATPPAVSADQAAKLSEEITQDVSGKVSEQVSKSVLERIAGALGLTKKEEEKLPTDAETLKKLVDERVSEEFNRLAGEAEQEETKTEEERQGRINSIISSWYTQYTQLANLGKVPRILKEGDQTDKGMQARKKLILAIGKKIEDNKKNGVNYVPSISDVLIENPNVLKGPPGADLPISGNTQAAEEGGFSYKEIANKSFEQIAREGAS